MTDLLNLARALKDRPTEADLIAAPKRRSTFIPVTGRRVNCWRIISRDPDVDEDNEGVLVEETDTHYFVQVDGENRVRPFEKFSSTGVRQYRI